MDKPIRISLDIWQEMLMIRADFAQGRKDFYRRNPAFARALRAHGFKLDPHFSVENYIGTKRDAAYVAAVLDALARPEGVEDVYHMASLLGGTITPFDGRFFIEMYKKAPTELIKQNIVLSAIQTKATGIDGWLRGLIQDRDAPMVRDTVIFLADHLRDKDGLMDEMLPLFEEFPRAVIDFCGKRGGERELAFLKGKLGWTGNLSQRDARMIATALKHAIGILERRVTRQATRTEKFAQKEAEEQKLREDKQRLKDEHAQDKRSKS